MVEDDKQHFITYLLVKRETQNQPSVDSNVK